MQRLVDEGYAISIRENLLVLEDVWYVDQHMQVRKGMLVSVLEMRGQQTAKPKDHKVFFAGDIPHKKEGGPITGLVLNSNPQRLAAGIQIHHEFSNQPPGGYENYYDKMKRYVDIINVEARAVSQDEYDARTYRVVEVSDQASPFEYMDTASTRARIGASVSRFIGQRIAIVGLGGTGAYIFDQVCKVPVAEIHLFDGDRFHQHNAFRSPGAAGIDTWPADSQSIKKVEYYSQHYSRMKRGIFEHPYNITAQNVDELLSFDYVFVCVDRGAARRLIIGALETGKRTFIDVGVGVIRAEDGEQLLGACRVTAGTPGNYEQLGQLIPMSDEEGENIYAENIQIADLNALNAILAVLKWKRLSGFYADHRQEVSANFSTIFNSNTNVAAA
ncbi:MAG: ThiF family adenylyltransferase [Phycisphaeraceae bacterium]|nr:ThiF family adenylyltransferase [Phycisphaeraceae bacterium]